MVPLGLLAAAVVFIYATTPLDRYYPRIDPLNSMRGWPEYAATVEAARETSGAWLRAAAAGLPTLITDLVHQPHMPSLDPRTWGVLHVEPTLQVPSPVAISIDVLDEDHSLRLALRRLVADEALRDALGEAARAYWAGRHTVAHMAEDYGRAIYDLATRRALIGIGEDMVNVAYDAPVDMAPRGQIEDAERRLFELAETGRYDGGFQPFSRIA